MNAPWFVWFAAWVLTAVGAGLLIAHVVGRLRGEPAWWSEDVSTLDELDGRRHNGRSGL